MSTWNIIWLATLGVLFVLWSFMMFRMLWQISRYLPPSDEDLRRGFLFGRAQRLKAFFAYFQDPAHKPFLKQVALATIAILAFNLAGYLYMGDQ